VDLTFSTTPKYLQTSLIGARPERDTGVPRSSDSRGEESRASQNPRTVAVNHTVANIKALREQSAHKRKAQPSLEQLEEIEDSSEEVARTGTRRKKRKRIQVVHHYPTEERFHLSKRRREDGRAERSGHKHRRRDRREASRHERKRRRAAAHETQTEEKIGDAVRASAVQKEAKTATQTTTRLVASVTRGTQTGGEEIQVSLKDKDAQVTRLEAENRHMREAVAAMSARVTELTQYLQSQYPNTFK